MIVIIVMRVEYQSIYSYVSSMRPIVIFDMQNESKASSCCCHLFSIELTQMQNINVSEHGEIRVKFFQILHNKPCPTFALYYKFMHINSNCYFMMQQTGESAHISIKQQKCPHSL